MTMLTPLKRLNACWLLVLPILAFGLANPASADESCWTEGPGQFADAIHYCVSSILPSQGGQSYAPRNLVGRLGEQATWCEGARGHGVGETITIRIDRGPAFRRLLISNGYGKTAKAFSENGRLKRVRITTDTGVDTELDLIDQPESQPLHLPLVAPHRRVTLEIRDVYRGARYTDTCVSAIGPDFEYEEDLLQAEREAAPTVPPAPVPQASEAGAATAMPRAIESRNELAEPENLPDLSELSNEQQQRAAPGRCLDSGARFSGRLELHEATHPAGQLIRSYHLIMLQPTCVIAGNDRIEQARRIQLVPITNEQRTLLQDRLGQELTVHGTFVEPHTAWQTGDALLLDFSLD